MGVLILIAIGGIFGWLSAIISKIEEERRITKIVVAGVIGALFAGILASGPSVLNTLSGQTLVWSSVGAAAALLMVHLLDRQTVR